MKEVKDVKNVDKVMKSVANSSNSIWHGAYLLGFFIATLIVIVLGTFNGLPMTELTSIANSLCCGAAGSTLLVGGFHVKKYFDKKKLKSIFEQVKNQTGIELDVSEAQVALEKTEINSKNSFDDEKTHEVAESEVIKRFYMLDKNEQMQVLEFARKTVINHMGKTSTQTLSVFEEDDKKTIDYVGFKKELKFIPKTPTTKED